MAGFDNTPGELVTAILAHLDSRDLFHASLINTRVWSLAREPLLWKNVAINEFRYWRDDANIKSRRAAPVMQTSWRQLVAQRYNTHVELATALDNAVRFQVGRLKNLQIIADHGYDSRDFLLQQLDTPLDNEYHLARTFWATQVLGQIDRRSAIVELLKLRNEDNVPLERALACIDLCVMEPCPMSLDDVSEHFDRMADQFKLDYPNYHACNTRQLAQQLLDFLVVKYNMLSVPPPKNYRDLRNSLITASLLDHDHPGLPLTNCAIYKAVASRLGISAELVNYPGTVYMVISAPKGYTLDGQETHQTDRPYSNPDFHTYLSPAAQPPFQSYDTLYSRLSGTSIPPNQREMGLMPTRNAMVLQRATNNIEHSRELGEQFTSTLLALPTAHFLPASYPRIRPSEASAITATHAASLVRIVIHRPFMFTDPLRRFLLSADAYGVLDANTVRAHLITLLPHFNPAEHSGLLTTHVAEISGRAAAQIESDLRERSADDFTPRTPKPRFSHVLDREPAFPIGAYFRHRRYGYHGVVVGWDRRCEASEGWMAQQGVDTLSAGRAQVFYNVADENGGPRYVAEENILPLGRWARERAGVSRVDDDVIVPVAGVWRIAGRWCRRWDAEREWFVSNLREEYPDD